MRRWLPHPDVLKLGFVSLLTDLSSELIFAVFALYFTVIAGGTAALLGIVEGLADFSSCALDYLAGRSADRSGRRKPLTVAGYASSSLAKLIPLLATTAVALGAFRVIERLGKSLRGAPRDAWLAAIAREDSRGYDFGVHRALDRTGAIVGPLCAYGMLAWLGEGAATYRIIFWVALIPAILAVILLLRVDDRPAAPQPAGNMFECWRLLGRPFKRYLAVAAIFSVAYFSVGFLLVRAHDAGFGIKEAVLLYALINLSFVASAPVAGRLGDRYGRHRLLLCAYLLYALICVGFAVAGARPLLLLLFVAYGVFHAIEDAQSRAFIADLEPERHGSAIGLYNFVTGLAFVPASLGAGLLWLRSPVSALLTAATVALLAAAAFLILRPAPADRR